MQHPHLKEIVEIHSFFIRMKVFELEIIIGFGFDEGYPERGRSGFQITRNVRKKKKKHTHKHVIS